MSTAAKAPVAGQAALAGEVVIVTGAGSGLGRGASLYLAGRGAQVAAVSLVPDELQSLEREAAQAGTPLSTFQVDVGDAAQVHTASSEILERYGRVDVLINNAGVIVLKPIDEMSIEEWDRVIATNLRSVFLFSRELVPSMKQRKKGLIINVSSQSGIMGFVGEAGYCPSKHGVEGLTKTLALELDPWNVFAVSVTPGAFMRTAMSLITLGPEQQAQWHEALEFGPGFEVLVQQVTGADSGRRFDLWQLAQSGAVAGSLAGDGSATLRDP
jgi:NAD(P)-dependent dehydrogenase (short-subunit alcohol dehydrogenase family)